MASADTTIRPFTWSDVNALASLQKADPAGVERWLRQPNLQPERDCIFAYEDDKLAGYAYLIVEPFLGRSVLLSGTTDAAGSQIAAELLAEGKKAARGLKLDVLQIDVPELDSVTRLMCENAGMQQVRTHLHMRRTSTDPCYMELPRGGAIRLAEHADVDVITRLQNNAFTGSWGYSPNTPEEIEYRIFELPGDAPDPVVLLEVGGQVVGYCWTHQDSQQTLGVVGMVGVWPNEQGKGYGRTVTAAGVDHLLEIGANPIDITVDSANTPAITVYEKIGFSLDWRSIWYEATLR